MALSPKEKALAIKAKADEIRAEFGAHVLTVSEETDDGGKAGVICEVPVWIAAKNIYGRIARLATTEEAAAYRVDVSQRLRTNLAKTAALELKTHALKEGLLRLAEAEIEVPEPQQAQSAAEGQQRSKK